jgi:putative redox protein
MLDSQPVDTAQKFNTMQIELVRVDDAFHFEAVGMSGVKQHMDAATDIGGHNEGARPMEMLLMGLAGCTAIDVILILQKQKLTIDYLRLNVEVHR